MHSSVTRFAVVLGAAMTIACGGRDQGGADTAPPATVTPGEAAGTSGDANQLITISGCVVKAPPDGYVLTSDDEAILREEAGTAGHHRDDEDTAPMDANRGSEDERLRHAQNPSAELHRYRLAGDDQRLAMHVGREVEIQGRVEHGDAENSTPATITIETIDATGPSCDAKR